MLTFSRVGIAREGVPFAVENDDEGMSVDLPLSMRQVLLHAVLESVPELL